jgi:hypothetical protein
VLKKVLRVVASQVETSSISSHSLEYSKLQEHLKQQRVALAHLRRSVLQFVLKVLFVVEIVVVVAAAVEEVAHSYVLQRSQDVEGGEQMEEEVTQMEKD